jgi:hypothetical protein
MIRKKNHLLNHYKILNVKKKTEKLHFNVLFVNQVHEYDGRIYIRIFEK